ncbi:MAG: hypothetical protein ACFE0P_03890 [Oceanicaulis sp.]
MSDTFHQSETDRRAHDGGRAARAWRWFSARTIRSAERYRDLSWSVVARRTALAGVVVAVSRIDPTLAISPWLLIGGGVWLVLMARIVLLKTIDTAARR